MTFKEVELYSNEWLNTVTHEDIARNIFPLIIDREQGDVNRVKELAAKGWDGMTADEKHEWLGVMKGAYNADDLNRVGWATEYIAAQLAQYEQPVSVAPKTDWTMQDIPTWGTMQEYRNNVRRIRNKLPVFPDTPTVPGNGLSKLTYTQANDIEKVLFDVETILRAIVTRYKPSGTFYSGNNSELQYFSRGR